MSWDIIRGVGSIDFWGESENGEKEWSQAFYRGYLSALSNDLVYWDTPEILRVSKPEKWQITPKKYFKSNEKWSKKVKNNLVPHDDIEMRGLFDSLLSQNSHLSYLNDYELVEQAKVLGSMGKAHFVYVLKKEDSYIYYDIKETYVEKDDQYFQNPFSSQGERMIYGSHLYSPGLELRMSSVKFNGADFWGREIPTLSMKLPKKLAINDQVEIARNIGIQLARGHRSSYEGDVTNLSSYFESEFDNLVSLSLQMNEHIRKSYKALKKEWK